MKKLSAKFLISLGLVIFMMGILMLAFELNVIPNPTATKLATRAKDCENIAVNSSLLANQRDYKTISKSFEVIVTRTPSLRSAALRRADGTIVASTENHDRFWMRESKYPAETHIEVPIFSNKSTKWGAAEFAYTPITQRGLVGFFADPTIRFLSFVVPLAFFAFYFYLGKMLKVVNAKSVPQRVRTALNTLAGGLIVTDHTGDIVLANDVIANWAGESPEKLMGRRADSLPWGDEFKDGTPWQQTIASQEAVVGKTATFHAVEGNRALIVNSSPMIGNKGELRGVFVGLEDVTVLQEKEIEHKRLRQEAERANSAKSEFLARMSHEIRTPMNAILGFTDVLRRGFDQNETERTDYLNTIHSSGEHLLSLINDILDLSKVEAGHIELEQRQVSPHKVILETLHTLRVRAEQKQLTLSYEPADQMPEFVDADPVRFRQIVTNLVGNAIKFTEQGGVRVVSTMVGDKFEFSVVDTGIGINEEALNSIFDPFAQADSSITRRFGGTGLGLAIAKRFSEMMGGSIRVASKVGKGTAFTVQIHPGDIKSVRRLTREEALAAKSANKEVGIDVKLPPCRVLIVDDGASNRRLLRLFLHRAGADLVEAENGLQAFEYATTQKFDAILMDMQMPVMDGYTASTKLREAGCSTPIIALTAHAMAEDETKCLNAGCSHFLPKPVDTNRLLQLMGEIIGGEVTIRQPAPAQSSSHSRSATTARTAALGAEATAYPPLPDRITSDLPVDIAEFHEIVEEFIGTLGKKFEQMRVASDADEYKKLAELAHWLKGSGGTVGFTDFTQPAAQLEKLAKQNAGKESISPTLDRIKQICDRIYLPELVAQ